MNSLVLGESLAALIDHRGKTPRKLGSDFAATGVPVASAQLVSNGTLNLSDARSVTIDIYRKWMAEPTQRGDVLLTSEAPLGRVARVPTNEPLVLGQRLFGLRGREGVLDSGFLYYALQTDEVQGELRGRATGSTVTGIRQSALRKVRIPAPHYEQQRAIAEVLGALDDKIAANANLTSTAERLAKAVVATRSPSVALSEVARQVKKTFAPADFGSDPVSLFSLPAFDVDVMPEETLPTDIKSAKILIDEPLVLISKLNPRFPRVWDVPVLPERRALASTEFVALASPHASSSVLWAILSQPSVSESLQSKVAGTSGSHQRVRPAALLDTPVVDPRAMSESTRNRLTSLGKVIQQRRIESQTLTTTRDALLPLLMSGKVGVKDAERAVDEVL